MRVNSRGLGACESRHSISLLIGTTCTVFVATSTVTSLKPKSSSSISCSRTRFRPSPAASRTLDACTVIKWRTPRLSKKETWHSRTRTRSIYHILLLFANSDTMLEVRFHAHDRAQSEPQVTESHKFAAMSDAELLTAYEFSRIACGIHEGKVPRGRTIRKFWKIWCELRLRERKRLHEP